jgi:hypothetical protein
MGETAAPGTGGSEVDADVVQVQAPLDIGSVVHPAPPLLYISTALCRGLVHRDLQERCGVMGNVGDIQTELFAECRQRNGGV